MTKQGRASARKWTNSKPVRVVQNYMQGTEELRVRPRGGEQVRRDLQGDQVLAREEQERIHCLFRRDMR